MKKKSLFLVKAYKKKTNKFSIKEVDRQRVIMGDKKKTID